MLENPEAVVFAARLTLHTAISQLKHVKQAAELDFSDDLVLTNAIHDIWEIAKKLQQWEEAR